MQCYSKPYGHCKHLRAQVVPGTIERSHKGERCHEHHRLHGFRLAYLDNGGVGDVRPELSLGQRNVGRRARIKWS